MSSIVHGGRLDAAIAKYGGTRAKWLDLSTGINAKPWPVPELDRALWQNLPDETLFEECRKAVRETYDVANAAHVSLAAGSQMHIQLLPYLFKPQAVAIVGFTYQEHGACWKRAGHEVYVTDGLSSAEATARIVVVVNPNNPDGRIVDREELLALSRRLAVKGGLLVVDEAFADVTPNASITKDAGKDGLFVLRSFGKFYGLAGVRLGAAICSPSVGEKLDELLGPWAISGPALTIGREALRDVKWRRRTRKTLSTAREMLEEMLGDHGISVAGGTDLFVLAKHDRAEQLAQLLAQKHILVRKFPGKPDWLRFGIPANKTQFKKLNAALEKFGAD